MTLEPGLMAEDKTTRLRSTGRELPNNTPLAATNEQAPSEEIKTQIISDKVLAISLALKEYRNSLDTKTLIPQTQSEIKHDIELALRKQEEAYNRQTTSQKENKLDEQVAWQLHMELNPVTSNEPNEEAKNNEDPRSKIYTMADILGRPRSQGSFRDQLLKTNNALTMEEKREIWDGLKMNDEYNRHDTDLSFKAFAKRAEDRINRLNDCGLNMLSIAVPKIQDVLSDRAEGNEGEWNKMTKKLWEEIAAAKSDEVGNDGFLNDVLLNKIASRFDSSVSGIGSWTSNSDETNLILLNTMHKKGVRLGLNRGNVHFLAAAPIGDKNWELYDSFGNPSTLSSEDLMRDIDKKSARSGADGSRNESVMFFTRADDPQMESVLMSLTGAENVAGFLEELGASSKVVKKVRAKWKEDVKNNTLPLKEDNEDNGSYYDASYAKYAMEQIESAQILEKALRELDIRKVAPANTIRGLLNDRLNELKNQSHPNPIHDIFVSPAITVSTG